MLKSDVSKPLLEHLVNTLIKGRDNFLGVLYQLSVQFGTELLEMLAGYVQVGFLRDSELREVREGLVILDSQLREV